MVHFYLKILYRTADLHFYESELTRLKVYEKMTATKKFFLEAEFGDYPHKILVFPSSLRINAFTE